MLRVHTTVGAPSDEVSAFFARTDELALLLPPGGEAARSKVWWHEHHVAAEGACTVVEDRVYYAVPGGPLGALVDRLLVGPRLLRTFAYRRAATELRFGTCSPPGR
jgi:ligand-binding SRPBCC domain-containing protein